MLPSESATLLCPHRADHPALAVTCVQVPVQSSSSEDCPDSMGSPVEVSAIGTSSGACPGRPTAGDSCASAGGTTATNAKRTTRESTCFIITTTNSTMPAWRVSSCLVSGREGVLDGVGGGAEPECQWWSMNASRSEIRSLRMPDRLHAFGYSRWFLYGQKRFSFAVEQSQSFHINYSPGTVVPSISVQRGHENRQIDARFTESVHAPLPVIYVSGRGNAELTTASLLGREPVMRAAGRGSQRYRPLKAKKKSPS